MSVKGHALVDFVVEFTLGGLGGQSSLSQVCSVIQSSAKPWEVFVDGASNSRGFGLGIILISPEGVALESSVRLEFPAFKNKAEYEAFLAGLQMAGQVGATTGKVHYDS